MKNFLYVLPHITTQDFGSIGAYGESMYQCLGHLHLVSEKFAKKIHQKAALTQQNTSFDLFDEF